MCKKIGQDSKNYSKKDPLFLLNKSIFPCDKVDFFLSALLGEGGKSKRCSKRLSRLGSSSPPKCCHGLLGVPRACHDLGSQPTGHATPSPCYHYPSGTLHAACPQGSCCLHQRACQRAHTSMPRPWLLHACPGLGSYMPIGCCLSLGYCMPMPWLRAHRGLPWPWLLHALMHVASHRPASSRTPAKLACAFFHFCVPKFIS